MRNMIIIAGIALLPTFTGCTAAEALFGVFGDHYSGGGYTRVDKERHFHQQAGAFQQAGASQHAGPWDW